ncbi:MAG: 6-phosphogluconolactonase [Gemmatimonadota bacterium]
MTERPEAPVWPSRPPPVGPVVVTPNGEFDRRAAERVAAELHELARRRTGSISVALAGGNTPRPVYEALAEMQDVAWARLEFFFGDERSVPPDDARSNYRMARESLLERVSIPASRIHRMRAEDPAADLAAREYASALPPALDLLLLGIGTDGHTASLFPGGDALHARRLVVASTAPEPPSARLTVTPPVLAAARRIVVLASGSAKADAVFRALTAPWNPEDCPAQLARHGLWVLDVASASALPRRVRRSPDAAREDST